MPDTMWSIYSEHDDASRRVGEEYRRLEAEIEALQKTLLSSESTSPECQNAVQRLNDLVGTESPRTGYYYVDEDGNDMYTTLGGGPHIPNLANAALKSAGLQPSQGAMEKYRKIH